MKVRKVKSKPITEDIKIKIELIVKDMLELAYERKLSDDEEMDFEKEIYKIIEKQYV